MGKPWNSIFYYLPFLLLLWLALDYLRTGRRWIAIGVLLLTVLSFIGSVLSQKSRA